MKMHSRWCVLNTWKKKEEENLFQRRKKNHVWLIKYQDLPNFPFLVSMEAFMEELECLYARLILNQFTNWMCHFMTIGRLAISQDTSKRNQESYSLIIIFCNIFLKISTVTIIDNFFQNSKISPWRLRRGKRSRWQTLFSTSWRNNWEMQKGRSSCCWSYRWTYSIWRRWFSRKQCMVPGTFYE